jgi:hypothetical protein
MVPDRDRVMIDIETLGLDPGAAVLSIGAVQFDPDGLGEEFYREISLQSCQAVGLEVDADTLEWWLEQDEAVSDVLTGGEQLEDALMDFGMWYPDGAEVWANSPSFDCEHLEAAYDAVGLTEPWEYNDERCVRTLRSLPGSVELAQDGDEHHALDDAKHQAREVSRTLARLDQGGVGTDD